MGRPLRFALPLVVLLAAWLSPQTTSSTTPANPNWDAAEYERSVLSVFRSALHREACASHLVQEALEALGPDLVARGQLQGGFSPQDFQDHYYWTYNNNNKLRLMPLSACDLNLLAVPGTRNNGGLRADNSGNGTYLLAANATTPPCQRPEARLGIFGHMRANRGIANQLEFANGHLARAKSRRWSVLPPIFHMDGYNLRKDFTLPFRFLFDQDAFDAVAAQHGLVLTEHAWPADTALNRCNAKRLNRKQMWNTERKQNDMSNYKKAIFLDSIKEAEKRPGFLYSISPFIASIPFSKHVLAVADPIVAHLKQRGGFVGIHFRVEIVADVGREKWASEWGGLFGNVRQNVRAICRSIRASPQFSSSAAVPKLAYVATYLSKGHSALRELQVGLEELDLRLVTKFDFSTEWEPTAPEDPLVTRNVLGLLEMAVLEQATFFVGHAVSSYSEAIVERRDDQELGPSDLMFLDIVRNAKNASSDAPKYMAATDKEEPPEQKAALGTFPMIAKLMKEADKTEGE